MIIVRFQFIAIYCGQLVRKSNMLVPYGILLSRMENPPIEKIQRQAMKTIHPGMTCGDACFQLHLEKLSEGRG